MIKRLAVPLLILLALAALAVWGVLQKSQPESVQPISCVNPVAGCTFVHDGVPTQISFSVTPETMKPFVITLSHPALRKVSASFQMIGMDMGFNRYDLHGRDGAYSARVTLPVCVSGRHDWTLYLTLDDRRYALPFSSR